MQSFNLNGLDCYVLQGYFKINLMISSNPTRDRKDMSCDISDALRFRVAHFSG